MSLNKLVECIPSPGQHNAVDYIQAANLLKARLKERGISFIETGSSTCDGMIPEHCSLSKADILIAGGRGIETRKGFEQLKRFAEDIRGELCVSRPVVDRGWFGAERMIGLSGNRVKPKIYIAVGISGAFQHIVGMMDSDYIIAVNNDRNAAIFDIADLGIVGDYRRLFPLLA